MFYDISSFSTAVHGQGFAWTMEILYKGQAAITVYNDGLGGLSNFIFTSKHQERIFDFAAKKFEGKDPAIQRELLVKEIYEEQENRDFEKLLRSFMEAEEKKGRPHVVKFLKDGEVVQLGAYSQLNPKVIARDAKKFKATKWEFV